ncbi:outer membrane beta-barrel protein [Lunatibacter salilacus]|uniref:outer membrane beta-barrel protein n=1 Tax=Lunatibacter salilacus TaxID=2483804 RepID=UPI00131DE7CA|nr:outer membrane beta-barrel protein [Lunatibacter salilacus]
MTNKCICWGLLLFFGCSPLFAQLEMNQVSMGLSYWQRTYSGADERAFLFNYPGAGNFQYGGLLPSISAEVSIYKGFAVDSRLGYWRGNVESHGTLGENFRIAERIDQIIIPVYGGIVYNFRDLIPKYLNGYVGAGISRYFLDSRFTRKVEDGIGNIEGEHLRGNNYGGNIKVGLEYLFPEYISMALEARYHAASYSQSWQAVGTNTPVLQKIDLKGLETGLFIRYNFSY